MRVQQGNILATIAVLGAIAVDWPRALAGLLIGWLGVYVPYATIFIPGLILAVAAIGEEVYALMGRTESSNWLSFSAGLVATGAAAIGMFQLRYCKREEI